MKVNNHAAPLLWEYILIYDHNKYTGLWDLLNRVQAIRGMTEFRFGFLAQHLENW